MRVFDYWFIMFESSNRLNQVFFALFCCFFFFKQKTAYEMRISDWSSDVCSSDLADLFERHRQALGHFLRGRLAAAFVEELAAAAHQLVDRLDHMHRDADRACLVGDRAGDRLTDPPGRIGREFIAAAIFEFADRLDWRRLG